MKNNHIKNINLYNKKDQRHGYWESYHNNGNLMFKGHYDNGKKIGYWKYYYLNKECYYARM